MNELLTVGEPMAVFASQDMNVTLSKALNFKKFSAGAELNVATGVARLGHSVQYISKISNDAVGNFISDDLNLKEIGTTYLFQISDSYTGFYFKQLVNSGDPAVEYFRKNSAVNRLTNEDINSIDFTGIKYVHVTGISVALSTELRSAIIQLIDRAHENDVPVIFDPNIRPQLWQSTSQMIDILNSVAQNADILIPGLNEGSLLTGLSDPKAIAEFYFEQGITSEVILKSGNNGALYFKRDGATEQVPSFHVDTVVDTVGAGDGFAAGFISGLLERLSIRKCLIRANAIGAMAIQSAGDNDGYPTPLELQNFLNQNKVLDDIQ